MSRNCNKGAPPPEPPKNHPCCVLIDPLSGVLVNAVGGWGGRDGAARFKEKKDVERCRGEMTLG